MSNNEALETRLQVCGSKITSRCRERVFNHSLGRDLAQGLPCLASVQRRKCSGKGLKCKLPLLLVHHRFFSFFVSNVPPSQKAEGLFLTAGINDYVLFLVRIVGSNLEINAYVNIFHKYCNRKKKKKIRPIYFSYSCDLFWIS